MSEWISVKDRLPDGTKKVLIAYRTWERGELIYGYSVAHFRTSGWWAQNFYTGGFFGSVYEPNMRVPSKWLAGNATHWMPLVEPPGA